MADNSAAIFDTDRYNDIASLELTVRNHPSSAFAKFLLLKQYAASNNPAFNTLLQQSLLQLDPLWLQFLLSENIESNEEKILNPSDESVANVEVPVIHVEGKTLVSEPIIENSGVENEGSPIVEEVISPNEETNEPSEVNNEIVETSSDNELPVVEIPVHNAVVTTENEIDENIEENNGVEEAVSEDGTKSSSSGKINDDESIDESQLFEPLHAVDYFASQGIIIREEDLTKDKLGKQMRSFSQWLKTMKQLHPNKLPQQNEVVEKLIQSSADKSNQESDILTEAMAEVLVKQNKGEKAIEMLKKLSLMNPSKSAYFAAKIEKIKNN